MARIWVFCSPPGWEEKRTLFIDDAVIRWQEMESWVFLTASYFCSDWNIFLRSHQFWASLLLRTSSKTVGNMKHLSRTVVNSCSFWRDLTINGVSMAGEDWTFIKPKPVVFSDAPRGWVKTSDVWTKHQWIDVGKKKLRSIWTAVVMKETNNNPFCQGLASDEVLSSELHMDVPLVHLKESFRSRWWKHANKLLRQSKSVLLQHKVVIFTCSRLSFM